MNNRPTNQQPHKLGHMTTQHYQNEKKNRRTQIIASAIGGIFLAIAAAISSWKFGCNNEYALSLSRYSAKVQQGKSDTITAQLSTKCADSITLHSDSLPAGIGVDFTTQTIGKKQSTKIIVTADYASRVGKYDIPVTGRPGCSTKQRDAFVAVINLSVEPPPFQSKRLLELFPEYMYMGDIEDTKTSKMPDGSFRIEYRPKGPQGWSGVIWMPPNCNFGERNISRDLSEATELSFETRSIKKPSSSEFKIGGISGIYKCSITSPKSTGVIALDTVWKSYSIPLNGEDLHAVMGGFVWVSNKEASPEGLKIEIRNVVFR